MLSHHLSNKKLLLLQEKGTREQKGSFFPWHPPCTTHMSLRKPHKYTKAEMSY
jgi:hypothetical protein